MSRRLNNISLREFRSYLEFHGLKKIRTKGGHEIWSRNDLLRPVILQTHIDPVPIFIVKNSLRTMRLTTKDLREFLSD